MFVDFQLELQTNIYRYIQLYINENDVHFIINFKQHYNTYNFIQGLAHKMFNNYVEDIVIVKSQNGLYINENVNNIINLDKIKYNTDYVKPIKPVLIYFINDIQNIIIEYLKYIVKN